VVGKVTHGERMDLPEKFEEHFLAAYLVAVERCDTVRLQVSHTERKHAQLAALGYSSKARKYVGCDVLDWFDNWWPREMSRDKVLPKLQERVELFSRRVSLEELGKRAKTSPRKRFVFFGFGSLSSRLLAALPAIGSEADVKTETIHGESLRTVTRSLAAFSLSPEAPSDNHFVRSVRLLADSSTPPRLAGDS
jgi:hypothetical protein